jgi:signal transduction histidine kinase
VCRRLKSDADTEEISIVQTSATYSSIDMKVKGLETGADGYLMQPFGSQELVATINSLVRIRRTELAQRRRADALTEADRKKDEFLAMLAHELRNPLAAIVGALGILETLPPRNDLERRAREVGRRQTRHLSRLIDDLLDVSRVMRGKIELKREPIVLQALLRNVAESVREASAAPREQAIELDLPDGEIRVEGDATRIEQVFTNLLDNASKYSERGGRIRVRLRAEPGADPQAVVTVADDGIGIAPEVLAHVFNLFYQADAGLVRGAGGLGIGLTLVRSLAELHGGKASVRSAGRGQGSEFEIRLPLLTREVASEAPRVVHGNGDGATRRVLIVEDNVDALATLKDLCQLWGHSVETASEGHEGVRRLLEWRPDIALVDVGLPGIDGFEVARRVRAMEEGRGLKMVALTGYGAAEHRERALAAGFDLHLTKPADPEALFALLRDGIPERESSRV